LVGIYDDVKEAEEKLRNSDIPFNEVGIDPYGTSINHLKAVYPVAKLLYRHYFQVKCFGIQNVPDRGRAMLVGNHSGGLPVDGTMLATAMILDHDPPRFAIGMVDKFAQRMPIVSSLLSRTGQVTGLRGQATRLLEEERLLMVFPEGVKGVGKLYKDRYNMVEFTHGFMHLAIKTGTPIIPFAFIGGEEAIPTVYHAKKLGNLLGAPYFPVTPYVLPLPKPVSCRFYFGEPMLYESGESYEEISNQVMEVKEKVNELIKRGLEEREKEEQ